MPLTRLDAPSTQPVPAETFSLFALGFRPFYLLAATFAAIAVPVWALVFMGALALPIPGMWWHAHEMLYGFAAAVIIGFLFTAGRSWTGIDTPVGGQLAALAALWVAGRFAMAFGSGPWVAVIDVAFLPVAAAAFLRVLMKANSRRNYLIGLMPALLALANLVFHLAVLGVLAVDPLMPLHFALALVVMLEILVGGRVIPMFTFNAVGARQWRNARFDIAATAAAAAALVLWAAGGGQWGAAVMIIAAAMQLVRLVGWNPWAARRNPLLWILHVSYLWIPLGLALLAAAQWGLLPRSAGIHALGIGAIGGLIIGMITRTALGHTGRSLVAGRSETMAYALVQVAALARVLTIAAVPAAALGGVHLAASAWTAAFLIYLWRYVPILTRARADGLEG